MINKKNSFFIIVLVVQILSLRAQDKFAEIGTAVYETREELLIVPTPIEKSEIYLPNDHDPSSVFELKDPISTKEELAKELEGMRNKYAPFMLEKAPQLENYRTRLALDNFGWRIETEQDKVDFISTMQGGGEWSQVNIPHYGEPLGRAVTYYYKDVDITQDFFGKGSVFLHFNGVDYKASIFLNGRYIGSHEGFFAPFEFDITEVAKVGVNQLLVKVENDFTTTGGNDDKGNSVVGDKIYAGTGVGYDDPVRGWHHCPPGMGIYQKCFIEARSELHLNDLFVRPNIGDSTAELWIEVNNYHEYPQYVTLDLSIYGQNFEKTVIESMDYIPSTTHIPGVGDLDKPTDWQQKRLKMGHGVNYLKVQIPMQDFRLWDLEEPWLYQLQVRLLDENQNIVDASKRQFGMRSFEMDTVNVPKGKMYLNGNMIRLRGANTMGHMQQAVINENWDQLRDDILLAKLANMNYLRLTQRPVQSEIYDYMDMLGLMNQTDLPLFGSIRRNKFAEAVKQVEEMERLVRSHPSTVMVSYINERFPNAEGHPQRSLNTLEEYNHLFTALDQAVLLNNPDRVIKAGDGDYDPPSPGLPDNHCYNLWYNGHGLGLGEMYKGYWQPVKPDWYYACGEFGAEGLDPVNVMKKYYPENWLPDSFTGVSDWNPSRINRAQTNQFHFMWYNTPGSVEDWVKASQEYQAWAVKFTTETFRRDPRMMSFAVHLFIDAWPAGWMKTIMDVDRQPKLSYFAYRNALSPQIITIRSDQSQFWGNDISKFEFWVSNDLNSGGDNYQIKYQVLDGDQILFANKSEISMPINSSEFAGYLKYEMPEVEEPKSLVIQVGLFDESGTQLHQNDFGFRVFPKRNAPEKNIYIVGPTETISRLVSDSGHNISDNFSSADAVIVTDYAAYKKIESKLGKVVKGGQVVIFMNLPAGNYSIAKTSLEVNKTRMGKYYFVSSQTDHELVDPFGDKDFWLWYDTAEEVISPILSHTVSAPDWSPILYSGDTGWGGKSGKSMAAGELKYGEGNFRFCEIMFDNKLSNPVAWNFLQQLLKK